MELGMVHHIAMDVTDYGRSKEFYVNKLGFAVLGEYEYPNGSFAGTKLCHSWPPDPISASAFCASARSRSMKQRRL